MDDKFNILGFQAKNDFWANPPIIRQNQSCPAKFSFSHFRVAFCFVVLFPVQNLREILDVGVCRCVAGIAPVVTVTHTFFGITSE